MKKCLCLLLSSVLLVGLCGCNNAPDTSDDGCHVTTTATTTTTTTTTKPYTPPASYNGKSIDDASGVPYSNAAPTEITNQMAREILEVLIPRQREVYLLGNVDWKNVDETQSCSCSKWFARYTNTKFQSAQDIRDLVYRVYIGEVAERWLNYFLDGTLDIEQNIFPRFHECDDVLYRSIYAEGKGLNEADRLWDTTRVVGVEGNVVRVEMYARYDETKEYDRVYTFALCKTIDGWRASSDFLECIRT